MGTGISEEEFARLQTQLLDLRAANYALQEEGNKSKIELRSKIYQIETLEKELSKALRVIEKSKKIREVESLLLGNEALQRKVAIQEEEFHLQNQTLLQELNKLVLANESYEKEISSLKAPKSNQGPASLTSQDNPNLQDENVQKLETENAALQIALQELTSKSQAEIHQLRQSLAKLVTDGSLLAHADVEIEGDLGDRVSSDSLSPAEYAQRVKEVKTQLSNVAADLSGFSSYRVALETERAEKRSLQAQFEKQAQDIQLLQSQIEICQEKLKKKQDIVVQLQEEKENQLAEQHHLLEQLKEDRATELNHIKEQNQRLITQLKLAQSSLQEARKEASEIQMKFEDCQQELKAAVTKSLSQQAEFDALIDKLQLGNQDEAVPVTSDYLTSMQDELRFFREEKLSLEMRLTSSEQRLISLDAQLLQALGQCQSHESQSRHWEAKWVQSQADLSQMLAKLEAEREKFQQNQHNWVQEKEELSKNLEEKLGLSNKRKGLLDELATSLQTKEHNWIEQKKLLETEKQALQDDLRHVIETYEEQVKVLQVEANKVSGLLGRIKELESLLKDLQQTVIRKEDDLVKAVAEHEKQVQELDDLNSQAILAWEVKFQEQEKSFLLQLEVGGSQITELEAQITRLNDELRDAAEDRRIAERRALAASKDVRRQWLAERKRADRLQERLKELFNETGHSRAGKLGSRHKDDSTKGLRVPDRRTPDGTNAGEGDACSISSWSLMSGHNDSHHVQGPPESPSSRSGGDSGSSLGKNKLDPETAEEEGVDLSGENARLLERVTNLQEEKWRLEERVAHLEDTSGAMAAELVNRGKLIKHYCMEGRLTPVKAGETSPVGTLSHSNAGDKDKISVKTVLNRIKAGGASFGHSLEKLGAGPQHGETDEVARLQRMLEETLTKNMHLQENLEQLSCQVVQLSQVVGGANIPFKQTSG